jgi:hypothetical protein
VAQQHYYVFLSSEMPGGYQLAKTLSIPQVFDRIFKDCYTNLDSMRPFFTTLLYFLTFKGFGFQPQVAWIMGIIVGSLLAPLYFWAITALVSVEVALASSLILVWMSDCIWQSIALDPILCGILFIVGALLAAARYHRREDAGYLYLSGCLVSMSVLCRYENAILVPAFIGYEFLFGKERKFFPKLVYGLLCATSSLFILYCNYHLYGDPLDMIRQHAKVSFPGHHTWPVPLPEAFRSVWKLLLRLLNPWFWGAAVAGTVVMVLRYRWRALWFFFWALSLPLYMVYKVKTGTLDDNEDYFFLLALAALPMGLECVRALFSGLGRRRIYGVIALGVVAFCTIQSLRQPSTWDKIRWNLPDKLIRLTEALKGIPATAALYVDYDLKIPGDAMANSPYVLFYLTRNPVHYQYFPSKTRLTKDGYCPYKTEPTENEYYLLTMDKTGQTAREGGVKVRDFKTYGYDGLALYRFTRAQEEARTKDTTSS